MDYFGRRAYLAQSPQFYKQAMVGVFERVYEIGPVFRAEPHDTARHLAQYTSLDAEFGFITDHRDVMAVLREVVAGHGGRGTRTGPPRRRSCSASKLPEVPAQIPQVHFADAQELIAAHAGWDPRGEPDLSPADERWLWRVGACASTASEFLFVTGYPMVKRPFYTHPDPDRPGYSRSFDLLFRGHGAGHRRAAAAPARATTWRRWPRAARTRRRTRATCRCSSTACRRTAASRSAWSAGRPG